MLPKMPPHQHKEWLLVSYRGIYYWILSSQSEELGLAIKKNLSAKFSSVTQSCLTLYDPMDWSTLGFPVHHQLLEPTQTHGHHAGEAIQSSHPHPLLLLPSIFPSIRVFTNESALCIRWPKYWSFSFNINAEDLGSIPGLARPLEKGKATHSSILAWRIQSVVLQRVRLLNYIASISHCVHTRYKNQRVKVIIKISEIWCGFVPLLLWNPE